MLYQHHNRKPAHLVIPRTLSFYICCIWCCINIFGEQYLWKLGGPKKEAVLKELLAKIP